MTTPARDLILAQHRHLATLADPRYWSDDGLEYFRGAAELLAAMIGAYEDDGFWGLIAELASNSPADPEWPVILDRFPSDSPAPELDAFIADLRKEVG